MQSTGPISAFTISVRSIVAKKLKRNRLLVVIAALFLSGFITGIALAASDSIKEGGVGGTGAPAMRGGIGGTGTPARGGIGGTGAPARGGIGGTGLQPDESAVPTLANLAGKVLFIVGQVEVQNLGQVRSLTKGDPVRVGDTLKSSKGASLQLRMEDGGMIMLRPESQLVIESFAYNGVQDGSEHMALALLDGGFRAVTGDIGHLHKENYSIRTPNATIAIRGTDHEAVFVPTTQPGQIALVQPGTYDHVISGATILQNEQGGLLIKPNQTGFAGLNGAGPIIINRTLPIFGDQKASSGGRGEGEKHGDSEEYGQQHGDMNNSGHEGKGNAGSSDSISGAEQNSRGVSNNGSLSGEDHNSSNLLSGTGQNNITQTEHLGNTTLDINTLETDGAPAPSGSAVVGAHMAGGLLSVGSAQAGSPEVTLLVEDKVPGSYTNNTTGFNFISNEGAPINQGAAQVDGVTVTWGIYAGGTAFDTSGKAIPINFHPFAYAIRGATPPAVVSSMSGSATFSNMVGSTKPVTESGNLGGSVSLNVGINLGAATVTSYNLAVTDANSRSWTGTLNNGPVALSTFSQNGTPLAVSCGGCGSGTASGSATGILIGPNAKGLISSYVLSTTTGQAAAGAVVMSRP
jgi:hypothetical protein